MEGGVVAGNVANNYGGALYELARDEGLSHQILEEISALADAFGTEPGFVQLLSTPSIPKAERCQIIDTSFRGQCHPYVLNFLKILTERGYVRDFADCCRVFRKHYNADNGILPVTAVTALPLDETLRSKLTAKLSEITGKTIDLSCRVDPDTLGGVRLDFDGKQVDGTVRRRLDDIRGILASTVI